MAYCSMCDRHFVSDESLVQHRRDAPVHRVCGSCDRHFSSASALDQHRRDSPAHNICFKCQPELDFEDDDDLMEHEVEEHNLCCECHSFFSSPSNLKNHLLTHARKVTPCPGCDRTFVSPSAMVLHLERGTCASGADMDTVNETARITLDIDTYTSFDSIYRYKCPACNPFRFMSGLLQHIESDRCGDRLGRRGPLDDFLDNLAGVLKHRP